MFDKFWNWTESLSPVLYVICLLIALGALGVLLVGVINLLGE